MARRRKKVVSTSQISSFTAKGTAAPGTLGSFAPTPLGHFDPTTGRVYQHPRLTANPLASSGHVRVTNPAASGPRAKTRTRSVGMGTAANSGQTGRTMGITGGSGD